MRLHRFRLGQAVRLRSRTGIYPAAADSYRVIRLLPLRDNDSPQYRLRNEEMRQERVAEEDSLEAATP